MGEGTKLINVRMVREDLDDIGVHPLPAGYTIRLFKKGDEGHFERIWIEADEEGQAKEGLFEEEFGGKVDKVRERMHFVCDGSGRPVATATAWYNEDWQRQSWGVVHWVAVAPEAQGEGLSKALMTAVLQRMKELGHERVYLITQTVRMRAIGVYFRFGFKPWRGSEEDVRNWNSILDELAR